MAWYQLFFQFEEVAEATLSYDDWSGLRELAPGYLDLDRAIANLSRPGVESRFSHGFGRPLVETDILVRSLVATGAARQEPMECRSRHVKEVRNGQ